MKKLALLLALLAACGGTSSQVKTAREARYNAPEATLFNEVKAVVAKDYPIVLEDPNTLTVKTQQRWHTPEGPLDQAPGDVPPEYELWICRREEWMEALPWAEQFQNDRVAPVQPVGDEPMPDVAQQSDP